VAEVLLAIQLEPLDTGGDLAPRDDLEGVIAQGRTVAETVEIAQDVARKLIESYLEHEDALPAKMRGTLKAGEPPEEAEDE
jgi:predicted RNase H-like HicB family nuclease